MRVKDAVLFALTKSQLKKLATSLEITGIDLDDANQLTDALSRNPHATAEALLDYLPDSKLIEVARFVPHVGSPTRVALLAAAASDAPDSESDYRSATGQVDASTHQ